MTTNVRVDQGRRSAAAPVQNNGRNATHIPPPPPPSPSRTAAKKPKKPFSLRLCWAYAKFWLWTLGTKALVTVVYLQLISQGLRYVLPDMGMRLSKLPGFAFLENYTATYRLDLAHIFTAVPLISAWLLWHWNLELYLRPEVFADRFRRWNLDRIKGVVVTMGLIVIIGDACLFAAAFTLASWGEAKFSASAILATLVYVTVLGFVTFVSLCLSESIDAIKKEED